MSDELTITIAAVLEERQKSNSRGQLAQNYKITSACCGKFKVVISKLCFEVGHL